MEMPRTILNHLLVAGLGRVCLRVIRYGNHNGFNRCLNSAPFFAVWGLCDASVSVCVPVCASDEIFKRYLTNKLYFSGYLPFYPRIKII